MKKTRNFSGVGTKFDTSAFQSDFNNKTFMQIV